MGNFICFPELETPWTCKIEMVKIHAINIYLTVTHHGALNPYHVRNLHASQARLKSNLFLPQQTQLCIKLDDSSPEIVLGQRTDEIREHTWISQSIHISTIHWPGISLLLRMLPLYYH